MPVWPGGEWWDALVSIYSEPALRSQFRLLLSGGGAERSLAGIEPWLLTPHAGFRVYPLTHTQRELPQNHYHLDITPWLINCHAFEINSGT